MTRFSVCQSQITQIWHFCTKLTSRGFKRFQHKLNCLQWELNSQLTITCLKVWCLSNCTKQTDMCWIGYFLAWILFHAPIYLNRMDLWLYKDRKFETGKLNRYQTSKSVMVSCEFNSHWRQFYFLLKLLRHLNANFVQKCQICVICENLE